MRKKDYWIKFLQGIDTYSTCCGIEGIKIIEVSKSLNICEVSTVLLYLLKMLAV